MSPQEFDEETLRLGNERTASHGGKAGGSGALVDREANQSDPKGIAGERAFARAFGFSMDNATTLPGGDGGVDFPFRLAGRLVTIDVKTAVTPKYLFVEKKKIEQAADILVLCGIDPFGLVTFIGWEYGITLAAAPVRSFGYGPNYYIPAEKLRPMGELTQILSRREA